MTLWRRAYSPLRANWISRITSSSEGVNRPYARSALWARKPRDRPGSLEALCDPGCRAILIAPSNPYLSIDPILAMPQVHQALMHSTAPVVAVSPIVGGTAVKGPTAKLMRELNLEVSATTVAQHYGNLIDAMLVDERDPPMALELAQARADTLMTTLDDRIRVAQAAIDLAESLAQRKK